MIDTASNTVINSIPVGDHPGGMAITPNGATVYVTNNGDDTVSAIDTASATVSATIPVGSVPLNIAVNSSGTTAYVTNANDGTVWAIDTRQKADLDVLGQPNGSLAVAEHNRCVYAMDPNVAWTERREAVVRISTESMSNGICFPVEVVAHPVISGLCRRFGSGQQELSVDGQRRRVVAPCIGLQTVRSACAQFDCLAKVMAV